MIALVRQTQEEFEAHGELNQLNLLLRDFSREIMERRLLEKVEFVRLKESNRLDSSDKGEMSHTGSGQLAN